MNIEGKDINLGFAITLTQEEFRGHYAPVFKTEERLAKAWAYVKKQKDASIGKQAQSNEGGDFDSNTSKKRSKGVHNQAEPEADIH